MFDFPASPTTGQKYPQPPVVGQPVYTWDGEKWIISGSIVGGGGGGASLTVSDTPPPGATAGSLWWESDTGTLFVYYNDGNSLQWVVASPQPNFSGLATINSVVRIDAPQGLSAGQMQQGRQNIYAAPFDAMAYGGLQINGAMEISQESGTTGTTVDSGTICDSWKLSRSGSMAVSGKQASAIGVFVNWLNFLAVTVTTAQTTLGASDYVLVGQAIEGLRVARLGWGTANAQPITLSFWSNHFRPGIYSVAFANGAVNRSYVTSYTQAASNVPQYNTVTIPGDTTGTWPGDNSAGLRIYFSLGTGSSNTASSANVWLGGFFLSVPGQVNALAATTDVFRITGVCVLPGNEAPIAARSTLVMRPYDQELALCKRYYMILPMNVQAQVIGSYLTPWSFPTSMRAPPVALNITAGSLVNATLATEFGDATTTGGYFQYNITGAGGYIINRRTSFDARL